jgi:hypothetical protein
MDAKLDVACGGGGDAVAAIEWVMLVPKVLALASVETLAKLDTELVEPARSRDGSVIPIPPIPIDCMFIPIPIPIALLLKLPVEEGGPGVGVEAVDRFSDDMAVSSEPITGMC